MSEFVKYQHLERLNHLETDGILAGRCYVFYKVDGTNASIWYDGENLRCGSRNRELSVDADNAGFMNWAIKQEKFTKFFAAMPELRLYGEWLVPHSIKNYRDNAWRDFYVFDVMDADGNYIPYETYRLLLEEFGINYIPPIVILNNPTEEALYKCLERTGEYLIKDGTGGGEGIVVKNYNWKNKHGRIAWAKLISNEFKEKHHKEMGAPIVNGTTPLECIIVDEFITEAFLDKEKAKLVNENGAWENKLIPRLLSTVFYELVREETWTILKKHKNPKIDFGFLQGQTNKKVKAYLGL